MAFKGSDVSPEKHTGFTFQGREIILSKTRGRPFTGLKAKGMEKGIYPEEKRIEAVTLYAATGHFTRTSELCGVPEPTIRAWRKQEWFQALLMEIREENNEKIDAKFTEIVEHAIDAIQDRVVNGDYRITKNGDVVRVPVGVRDLSLVAAINIDKRQLLRGLPTSRTESVSGPNQGKLEKLAEAFEALANKTRPRLIEVQTVEVLDANESRAEELSPVGQEASSGNVTTEADRLGGRGFDQTVYEPQGEELVPKVQAS